jgi:hypothetical protein
VCDCKHIIHGALKTVLPWLKKVGHFRKWLI